MMFDRMMNRPGFGQFMGNPHAPQGQSHPAGYWERLQDGNNAGGGIVPPHMQHTGGNMPFASMGGQMTGGPMPFATVGQQTGGPSPFVQQGRMQMPSQQYPQTGISGLAQMVGGRYFGAQRWGY